MDYTEINLNHIQAICDEHQDAFAQFENLLIEQNRIHNLTRITSPEEVRLRHFVDSLAAMDILDALAKELKRPLSIVDLGSGAGFPSLALAIARPDWSFTSLEATGKKVQFQQKVCDALGLKNVSVTQGRAEALAHELDYRQRFDVVTARALAAMPMLAELSLGFVRPGGCAIYWKGSQAKDELTSAEYAIKHMKAEPQSIASYLLNTDDPAQNAFALIVCAKTGSTPSGYPRPFGVIKRKPLTNTKSS